MKEYNYRAWDGEQMVSPDYITRKGIAHWTENNIPTTSDKIMCATGIPDCDGKMIFEGDKLQVGDPIPLTGNESKADTLKKGQVYIVSFNEGRFGIKKSHAKPLKQLSSVFVRINGLRVIGHIYEPATATR